MFEQIIHILAILIAFLLGAYAHRMGTRIITGKGTVNRPLPQEFPLVAHREEKETEETKVPERGKAWDEEL